jgi:hypothetical protein
MQRRWGEGVRAAPAWRLPALAEDRSAALPGTLAPAASPEGKPARAGPSHTQRRELIDLGVERPGCRKGALAGKAAVRRLWRDGEANDDFDEREDDQ